MYRIRKPTLKDIDGLLSIENLVYNDLNWSKETFISEISSPYSTYICFEIGNDTYSKIIAYAGYWKVLNEGHIVTIVVSPDYRKKHISDILLYSILSLGINNSIAWFTLEVRISNFIAIALYSKYLFSTVGVRKKYYQDNNEDALVLWSNDLTIKRNQELITDIFNTTQKKYSDTDIFKYTSVF